MKRVLQRLREHKLFLKAEKVRVRGIGNGVLGRHH